MAGPMRGSMKGLRGRGSFNVDVQLAGDWLTYSTVTNNMATILSAGAAKGQKEFARDYQKKVKQNMREGGKRFGYREHSSEYARFKKRKGGYSGLFQWSGTLIRSVKLKKAGKNRYSVGIHKGKVRRKYHATDKNRLQVHEYANVLEHGAPIRSIPKRPIFSDTFRKDMKGKRGISNYVNRSIKLYLASAGLKVI